MMNKDNFLKYKEIIQNEINTSIELLNNYLEFNKISLCCEEMDFNLLLSDIKKSMKDYLKKQGVSLYINYIDDEIYMNADYNRLKQVFYNIIKNSVEASSKKINIFYEVTYNNLEITITNDGDKIQSDVLNKIGNNYSNKILGNGIGTTLSKKIIEMHNGKIKYENNKGKGISIKISLPM